MDRDDWVNCIELALPLIVIAVIGLIAFGFVKAYQHDLKVFDGGWQSLPVYDVPKRLQS